MPKVPGAEPEVEATVAPEMKELAEVKTKLNALSAENEKLKTKLEYFQKKQAEKPAEQTSGDVVVLSGQKHDIVMRERVVDMVTAWRGRFVHDDDIVLLVKKA